MQLPNLDDLFPDQLDALRAPIDKNLFVVGPPGSGKTSIAVQRAIIVASQGKRTLLVTKNRMLALLAKRMGNSAFETSTMHRYVWNDYQTRFNTSIPIRHNRYSYNWSKILNQCNQQPGYTHDHIIIDEGQNLPAGFYPWVVRFGGEVVSVFADEDQTTDSENARISDIRNAPLPSELYLYTNHRNTWEIAQVAEFFHTSTTVCAGLVPDHKRGSKPSLIRFTAWENIALRISNRFRNRRDSIGVIVDTLATAKRFRSHLKQLLSDIEVRIDLYENQLRESELNDIDIMAIGITIVTGQSAIGLEFDCVYLQDLPRKKMPPPRDVQRKMYMLCARAKKELFFIDGPVPMGETALTHLPDESLLSR